MQHLIDKVNFLNKQELIAYRNSVTVSEGDPELKREILDAIQSRLTYTKPVNAALVETAEFDSDLGS